MSRLPSDRNSQQQPQQHNQIQQIIQPQHQALQINRNQQQVLSIPTSGSLIIINSGTSDGTIRTTNVVNTIPSSIYYTTPPAAVVAGTVGSQIITTNVSSSQSVSTSHLDPTSPIAKKRLKLEAADSSSSCGSTEDFSALKKQILEQKLLRFKALQDR